MKRKTGNEISNYLTGLLDASGSWAATVPIIVPTLAASDTTMLYESELNMGGSSTSSTIILTVVTSLNGPRLKKRASTCLFAASILSV